MPRHETVHRPFSSAAVLVVCLALPGVVSAQQPERLTLRAGVLPPGLRLDGILDEPAWREAAAITTFTMVDPVEGGALTGHTVVRVLANATTIIVGVEAQDPEPRGIVSYSKARDAQLNGEDHVKIILDTFLDGRSGYIFAVNPGGARYDALVARQGEGENSDWDAAWEAATAIGPSGWSLELRIPIQSLTFNPALAEWGFNVERRLERLQEVSRWESARRDAKISQTSRAGRLTELPRFNLGVGLSVRPSAVASAGQPGLGEPTTGSFDPSLDVTQRIGANVVVSGTANTDFGETEVDTRRTNLTRFSLFFPEKRTFFLEGADIFDFGIGLQSGFRTDLVPFFSRRIGLLDGQEVALQAGGKVNGRIGDTNFAALAVRTGKEVGLTPATEMGAFRIKQNVLSESSVGVIGTFGDPEGRGGSWMTGADFTYQTSRLAGDKNFLLGGWVMTTGRDGLGGDKTAFGAKVDYPNDTWDVALNYKRVGDGFDPSLGFVARSGAQFWSGGVNYRYRPAWPWLRMMFYEFLPALVLDLDGRWESYRMFTAPVNWRFESGERLELNVVPEGERITTPFEIADGVVIPAGSYHWVRYRIEADVAAKRRISGRVSWWFGDFYDGTLSQLTVRVALKPSQNASFELSAERNSGNLSGGSFVQEIAGGRVQINFSPDLQVNSLVQYDNDSRTVGSNTRLRWTFDPLGDVFLVYNHNVVDLTNRWALESNQVLLKVQYAIRR